LDTPPTSIQRRSLDHETTEKEENKKITKINVKKYRPNLFSLFIYPPYLEYPNPPEKSA
jgi:hypothetical protein